MDALQSDIDALENERIEMKKKLELYAKKSNMDLSRMSPASTALTGIVCMLILFVWGISFSMYVKFFEKLTFLSS